MKRFFYCLALLLTLVFLQTTAMLPLSFAAGPEAASYRDGDGMYTVRFSLKGGDGRETLHTPATLNVTDGKAYAIITWDSGTYQTLTLDGKTFKNSGTEKNARFEFPVTAFDEPMTIVMNDTDEYQITFDKSSVSSNMMMGIMIGGTSLFIAFILGTRYYMRRKHRR